jgi:hypothetical protein
LRGYLGNGVHAQAGERKNWGTAKVPALRQVHSKGNDIILQALQEGGHKMSREELYAENRELRRIIKQKQDIIDALIMAHTGENMEHKKNTKQRR